MAQTNYWKAYTASAPHASDEWAISDRGWLLAECEPWERDKASTYTHDTMPVRDKTSSTGWREQSTVGCYLRYSEAHGPDNAAATVHAVSYAAKATQWFETVEQAQCWIETRSMTARPDLYDALRTLAA